MPYKPANNGLTATQTRAKFQGQNVLNLARPRDRDSSAGPLSTTPTSTSGLTVSSQYSQSDTELQSRTGLRASTKKTNDLLGIREQIYGTSMPSLTHSSIVQRKADQDVQTMHESSIMYLTASFATKFALLSLLVLNQIRPRRSYS